MQNLPQSSRMGTQPRREHLYQRCDRHSFLIDCASAIERRVSGWPGWEDATPTRRRSPAKESGVLSLCQWPKKFAVVSTILLGGGG
jgi:hypothetical protein